MEPLVIERQTGCDLPTQVRAQRRDRVAIRHEPVALVLAVEAHALHPEVTTNGAVEQSYDPAVALIGCGQLHEVDLLDVGVDHGPERQSPPLEPGDRCRVRTWVSSGRLAMNRANAAER